MEGDPVDEPGADGRIIIIWIFETLYGKDRLDRSGSG
jgi:hypothetical protein